MTAAAAKTYPDCWLFDENRRVYRKDKSGNSYGGPIWREHWRKVEIVGETSRSWLTSCHRKVPKNGSERVCFSKQEITNQEWIHEHKYKIARLVERCHDWQVMKAIADLVGFVPSVE